MKFIPEPPQKIMIDKIVNQEVVFAIVGMGIGKSSSVLAAFCELQKRGEVEAMLVIAPLRVCNLTWPMEVQQWDQFKHLKVANLRTPLGRRAFIAGHGQIYVCNYEAIPMLVKLVDKRGGTVPYQMIVYDECFPAGTLVDTPDGPTKIESLEKGSRILNVLGEDYVYETYRNRVHAVAVITTKAGRKITCSASHKFFTAQGWIAAENLSKGEILLSRASAMRVVQRDIRAEESQLRLEHGMLSSVRHETGGQTKERKACADSSPHQTLRGVRGGFPVERSTPEKQSLLREILFSEMAHEEISLCSFRGFSAKDVGQSEGLASEWFCFCDSSQGENLKPASYVETKCSDEVEQNSQGDGAQTSDSGREWQTHTNPPDGAFQIPQPDRCEAVGARAHPTDKRHSLSGSNALLLSFGHRVRGPESLDRSGWSHSQRDESSGCRQAEEGSSGNDRVESVEVLQSDDPRLDGFRDADGFVYFYDLGVRGHPSYSVEGLLVHNCTKAKNPASKRINLLRREIPAVPRRVNLSGTPSPNSLLDLFAQVRLLDDGHRLGRSFDHFKKTYFAASDYQQYNWEPIAGAEDRIEARIADITLTLRTSDWLKDIPDCHVEDVEVKLASHILSQYEEFKKKLILELRQEVQITAANAAVLVRKLLQFTSGCIYDAEKKTHEVHDEKIKALGKLVKQTKGPILVICDFKHEQDRIRRRFPQARFFADAKTPALQTSLISQWNRKEIPVLVGHPMSMGHGLNLQMGSQTMVWMSLTYSQEQYAQTIARLHRRGQKDVVIVHRLMVPGTVDDVVAEVLEEKRNTEQRLLTALMLLEGDRKGRPPLKLKPSKPEEEEAGPMSYGSWEARSDENGNLPSQSEEGFDEEAFWG